MLLAWPLISGSSRSIRNTGFRITNCARTYGKSTQLIRNYSLATQEQFVDTKSSIQHAQSSETLGYSPWQTTNPVRLSKQSYLDLLHGKTPTIWEPGFVSPKVAWEYEKQLSPKLTPYTHNTGPLLTKVGVAQFEYQAQTAEDFTKRTNGTLPYLQDVCTFSLTFHRESALLSRSKKVDEHPSEPCGKYRHQSLAKGLHRSLCIVS